MNARRAVVAVSALVLLAPSTGLIDDLRPGELGGDATCDVLSVRADAVRLQATTHTQFDFWIEMPQSDGRCPT